MKKVLTIKNPWATLIVDGYKKYEFRSWKTNYRGKILIHSSIGVEKNKQEKFNLNCVNGAIIGEADLVDCILVDDNFDNELRNTDAIVYESNHVGNYAWELENVKKYDEPIFIKGKLGLWNYEGDELK